MSARQNEPARPNFDYLLEELEDNRITKRLDSAVLETAKSPHPGDRRRYAW